MYISIEPIEKTIESRVLLKRTKKSNTGNISALWMSLRPYHWIKNTFVFAPLIFSGRFTQLPSCMRAVEAFIGFCLLSSTVYIINDLFDRKEDQLHPVKKNRPIANGTVSPSTAVVTAIFLVVCGLVAALFLGTSVVIIFLTYLLINLVYSLVIKHIPILDVLFISFGFILRVAGGGAAISVLPSYWLILCTLMLAMFLGFTKRRVELLTVDIRQNNFRPVLKDYSIAFLDQVIPIVTGATIISYALYTVDEHTLSVLGSRAMLVTLPFVVYGLIRYLYVIYHLKKNTDPTETLIHDMPTIINLMLWILASILIVEYGRGLTFFQ
jgi:4-hydroxybenzoate polyprenyltransferase